jgi:hypothetical protein
MGALRRHAMAIGMVLFAAGAVLFLVPFSADGQACGSALYPKTIPVGEVETVTATGKTVRLPDPDDANVVHKCTTKVHSHRSLAVGFAVGGLVGVYASIVGAPEFDRPTRRRPSRV